MTYHEFIVALNVVLNNNLQYCPKKKKYPAQHVYMVGETSIWVHSCKSGKKVRVEIWRNSTPVIILKGEFQHVLEAVEGVWDGQLIER